MGIITKLFEKRDMTAKQWLTNWLGGTESASGIRVSEDKAMKYTAVFACVKVISETIASLPLITYRRLKRGKERAVEHSLYNILHRRPNSEMTSFNFWETAMVHLLLWGNFYSEIEYNNAAKVKSLWLLLPWNMKVSRVNGELIYKYTLPDNTEKIIPKEYILHIPGLGFNGTVGKSPIAMAREAIGLGLAMEEFGGRFFGNNTNLGGIVSHPRELSKPAYNRLKKQLKEKYEGLGKSHRLLILEEGMKYEKVTIPPDDAQFLDSRKFQLVEIARIYRVQPHKIMDLEHATFSNIEEQNIEFVVDTVRPWLVRIEQVINTKLYPSSEQKIYFSEFLVDGLLRGDTKSRYEAYAIGKQWGWLSSDDIRELENMNPIPKGGDIYWMPLNMISAGSTTEPKEEKMIPAQVETRQIRSASTKKRLSDSYRSLVEDATVRIIKIEKADILRAAKSIFDKRSGKIIAFYDFLEEYYEKMPDTITKRIRPVFASFSEAIYKEALEEINAEDKIGAELEKFMQEYQDTFNKRYIGSSKGQLKQVVRQAIEEDLDPVVQLEDRFTEWEDKRPKKTGLNEVVKIAGAVSLFTYATSGITKIVWHNTGSKSCPYCEELDGTVVGIDQPFMTKLDTFQPEGAEKPLTFSGNVRHPPLHGGCVCMITAG